MSRFRIYDLGFKNKAFLLILTTYFLLLTPGLAYIDPGKPTGHINDFAHLLQPETITQLEQSLTNFQNETGAEVAVVTIDTHGTDETIETYAEKLFQKWGIGKAKEDNGLLLLIAKDDREMRIEVGYGLEPVITDIESAHIISDVLAPAFRDGNYDEGVIQAVNRITEDIRNGAPEMTGEESNLPDHLFPQWLYAILILLFYGIRLLAPSKSWWFGGILGAIFGAIFFWSLMGILLMALLGLGIDFWVSKTYKKESKSDHWFWGGGPGPGGGRGGGGFGGFGGGMSGGGGASGKW